MLHVKQKNNKKTCFPRFDKILVIQPIAEVYGEGNERQLCLEIVYFIVRKLLYIFKETINASKT